MSSIYFPTNRCVWPPFEIDIHTTEHIESGWFVGWIAIIELNRICHRINEYSIYAMSILVGRETRGKMCRSAILYHFRFLPAFRRPTRHEGILYVYTNIVHTLQPKFDLFVAPLNYKHVFRRFTYDTLCLYILFADDGRRVESLTWLFPPWSTLYIYIRKIVSLI